MSRRPSGVPVGGATISAPSRWSSAVCAATSSTLMVATTRASRSATFFWRGEHQERSNARKVHLTERESVRGLTRQPFVKVDRRIEIMDAAADHDC
jgi:hypothetical protein